MRLTTKGRYAVSAMLDLAAQPQAKAVSLSEIAERQEISVSYLEQLFSKLRRKGLVESQRGAGGGYRLAKSAESLSVLEIITSVEESIDATNCEGKANCKSGKRCNTHNLWHALSLKIEDFLSTITLSELLKDPQALITPSPVKFTDQLKLEVST